MYVHVCIGLCLHGGQSDSVPLPPPKGPGFKQNDISLEPSFLLPSQHQMMMMVMTTMMQIK